MEIWKKILMLLGLTTEKSAVKIDPEHNGTSECNLIETISMLSEGDPFKIDLDYVSPIKYPAVMISSLKSTVRYIEGIERADKGVLENYFFDYAFSKLNKKLKNDVKVEVQNYSIIPDFIYADEETEVFIIVEIDEPYTINSENKFIPIHYKGYDDKRNQELLNAGWNIIRFAEEQIAKSPTECAAIIAEFVNGQFSKNIEEVVCWNFENSLKMIESEYRNTYLPQPFSKKLRNSSNYSYRSFDIALVSPKLSKKGDNYVVLYLGYKIEHNVWDDSCECWIPEEIFWNKFNETSIRNIVHDSDGNYDYDILKIYFWPNKFEALGRREGTYFTLSGNKANFNLVFSPNKLLVLKMKTIFNSKHQLREAFMGDKLSFEEKVKLLAKVGYKEVYISTSDAEFQDKMRVIKKFGLDVKSID